MVVPTLSLIHIWVLQRLELLENNLWNQENKCSKEIPDQEKSLQEQISLEKRIMDELESWLSAHPYRRGMPKTVLLNQISKGKKEQNREIQKCLILLEEHGNVGCIRLQQENSSIEPVSYTHLQKMKVERILAEPLEIHKIFSDRKEQHKFCLLYTSRCV